MSNVVGKRSEILFCYDVTDANPNGDPLDGNRPRIDEETGINIVTDVRLKRTIRDYLHDYKDYNGKNDKDIFVREIVYDNEGHIQDAKLRAKDFIKPILKENQSDQNVISTFVQGKKVKEQDIETIKNNIRSNLIKRAIDVRLFGATVPLEFLKSEVVTTKKSIKTSVTFTGTVQFKMGRSLHQVEIKHIKGTGAFASKKDLQQKTIRDEYILPYSFIAFHGIINETAASHTGLTDSDADELNEALWNGTKNLISRSKFGQMPRLLIKVTYKDKGFFIGDLDKKIKVKGFENPLRLRSIKDFTVDISELLQSFDVHKDEIDGVQYKMDENLKIGQEIPGSWRKLL